MKTIDLEDVQVSMQKELDKMNTILKKHETYLAVKEYQDKSSNLISFFAFFSQDIHWKSFAGGVLALASTLAFIRVEIQHLKLKLYFNSVVF